MTKPEITVCTHAFNNERHLDKAIRSVLGQTFRDFELLIVDDCSMDRSYQIAGSVMDSHVGVTRNERNLELVGNWNRCVSLACGEFVYILHGDDFRAIRPRSAIHLRLGYVVTN